VGPARRNCLKIRGELKIVTQLNLECVFATLTPALSHGERELAEPVVGPLSLRERVRVRG